MTLQATVVLDWDGPGGTQPSPVDITDHVYGIDIDRGKARELDEINTGTATVRFRNYDRSFDPTFAGATVPSELLLENGDNVLTEAGGNIILDGAQTGQFGTIRPGTPVQIKSQGDVVLFTGWVEDWDYVYTPQGVYQGSFLAVDALGRLGRRELAAHTATAAQTSGARVTSVLARSEIDWTETTAIDTGKTQLQGDTVDEDTNCLNYLQTVAATESGRLFAARTGEVTFLDRSNVVGSSSSVTFSDDVPATGLPFSGVSVTFGSDLLYTRVTVERTGGTAQTALASSSAITEFEIRSLTLSGLLMDSDSEALNLAEFLAGKFSEPEAVVTSITFALDRDEYGTDGGDADDAVGLEIGDVVQVIWTPTGQGDQSSQTLTVEGVRHSLGYDQPHTMSLSLSNTATSFAFILNSATLGVLSSSRLGY